MNRAERIIKLNQIKENIFDFKDLDNEMDHFNKKDFIKDDYPKYMKTTEYRHLFPEDGLYYLLNIMPFINTDEFLDYNSDIISSANLIKYLGKGINGFAYLTADNTVFKIYTSHKDYINYKNMYNQQFLGKSNPYDPKIYNVGIFDTTNVNDGYVKNPFVAYVEMEYLKNIHKIDKDSDEISVNRKKLPESYSKLGYRNMNIKHIISFVIDRILDHVHANITSYRNTLGEPDFVTYFKSEKNIESFVNKMIIDLKDEIFINDYLINIITEVLRLENSDWFPKIIISAILNHIKGQVDLHHANIGFRDSTPVFFDS